jgi:hypothetical protein
VQAAENRRDLCSVVTAQVPALLAAQQINPGMCSVSCWYDASTEAPSAHLLYLCTAAGRAVGLSVGALVAGILLGAGLNAWLQVDIVPIGVSGVLCPMSLTAHTVAV